MTNWTAAREELGLTQAQAAQKAGIGQATVSRIESGEEVPEGLREKLRAILNPNEKTEPTRS